MREMQKILVVPDSFKSTLTSIEICGIMRESIFKHYPACEVFAFPVADGGEGSVDAFLAAMGGEKVYAKVTGPFLTEEINCAYGLCDCGNTAVIEMAACSGLPLAAGRLNPREATTYGVGQLIKHAACESGCKKIILCLGGSATNDLGMGMAAALGVRFLDEKGESFVPVGQSIRRVKTIDISGLLPQLQDVEVIAMCDIDNPLTGENGAAHVFAPQKGADPETVCFLDEQLCYGAKMLYKTLGIAVDKLPGAGAAGGLGAGAAAFLGAKLKMGIETVLDAVDFEKHLTGASLVLTGEGKIDAQSLRGKVVMGVARRAKRKNVPVVAVVGDIGENMEEIYEQGITAVFSTNCVAVEFAQARLRSRQDMALTMDNLMRFVKGL